MRIETWLALERLKIDRETPGVYDTKWRSKKGKGKTVIRLSSNCCCQLVPAIRQRKTVELFVQ